MATASRLIGEASAAGAAVVVFPELFLCCYDLSLLRAEPGRCDMTAEDPRVDPVRDACREGSITAVVSGSIHDDDGRTISALVIGRDGETLARYDKQHVDEDERDLFRPGREGCAFELDGWRLALGICYDATFPEHARAAALDGAHAYLCPSSHTTRSVVHQARAYENTMYVVFSNHLGEADGRRLSGHSSIYGPGGELLADAGPRDEGLAVADLSASEQPV